ncbi:tautomerase family protein [Methanobacterium sp.]|uniref:tautomerase family protein n=1 Tax=Methanobacterium sp. TaxID=2164 RepID=UPI003C75CF1D
MPFVNINVKKGKSGEYKVAILDGVRNALIETIKVSEDNTFQRIYELDEENFIYPRSRTENVTIIEITMYKGRTVEAKKDLYKAINLNLAKNPGIAGNDISIVIYDLPPEDMVLEDGKPINE